MMDVSTVPCHECVHSTCSQYVAGCVRSQNMGVNMYVFTVDGSVNSTSEFTVHGYVLN